VRRVAKVFRSPPVLLLLVLVAAAAWATRDQWDWLLTDGDAQTIGAFAPALDGLDEDTERLYRITTDNGSSLTYAVEESLAGDEGTARGTTTSLAGDVAVNVEDPGASRLGTIVMNVEQFESDSALRDKRIRHDFLESTHHPLATFEATAMEGIPDAVTGETTGELTVTGDLTIKETTAPVTFTGPVTVDEDVLEASMTGTVLMSTYDIGPIHVAGLAHTEDEVDFELEITAERTDVDEEPPSETDTGAEPVEFAEGEFAGTVQPILESACVSCHQEDGPGFSTVEMDTAGKAAEIADDLALVTESRYMPPWPASDLSPQFEHDFSLTDEEIDTIGAWAADGGGLDIEPGTELAADDPPFDDIERDQVVPSNAEYIGDLAVQDDYRCQIHQIEDPEADGEWVTGIAFEPDEDEVVHHSIIFRVPAEGMEEALELDGSDGRPGWTCFGRSNMQTPGVVSIGGWAPGQQPRVYPEGVGMYLQPGDFIVNQIHYHYDHETPADQSTLVFDTLSTEEVEQRDEPMTSVAGNTDLTPAEGPCTPEEEGPLCDRETVLDDIGQKYGIGATFIPDALIGSCGGTIDDYDDLDGTRFDSSCDMRARNIGTLYSVLGHMHEFGDAYRMTLNPDTPEERILLDIPSWSFEWQLYYVPTEEIRIEEGDTIRFECTWDRANLHMPEPRYITWNEGTVDEMCFSSVSVIPDTNVEGEPNSYSR
jgi:polyisoprenoid-binding protein YceI